MGLEKKIEKWINLQNNTHGRVITCNDILTSLDEKGAQNTTKRRVQQILNKLVEENEFIEKRPCIELNPDFNGRYNEYCYYCTEEFYEKSEITDPITAFLLVMVNKHLKNMIPKVSKDYFESAEDTLEQVNDIYKNWTNKVVSSPLPYEDNNKRFSNNKYVVNAIYQALLKGTIFYAEYHGSAHDYNQYGKWVPKANVNQVTEKKYHPLGLILRGHIVYLVAKCEELYPNTTGNNAAQHFALHKFKNVMVVDEKVNTNNREFTNYVDNCVIDEPINPEINRDGIVNIKRIKLELKVSEAVAEYFKEDKPYQLELQNDIDGWSYFSADNVPDTEQLRRWISSLRDHIEVIKPNELRGYFREIAHTSLQTYNK